MDAIRYSNGFEAGSTRDILDTSVTWSAAGNEQLIAACIEKGDEAAWQEFIRRFRPVIAGTVLRTARRFGEASPQMLDDLVQESYLKICANRCRVLRDFKPQVEESIFGLLKKVAFSVVHDHFRGGLAAKRGGGRLETGLDIYAESAVAGREGLPEMEREILLSQVDECLLNAPATETSARDRRIFWLYYRHGMTSRAIAAIAAIDLTQKGVESVIQRLTNLVRRQLVESRLEKAPGKHSQSSL